MICYEKLPKIPSWSRVNNSKINLSTNINGYLHFTVLLWKVTLWFANSCFSVDTPVYRIINYPEDNKPMPFSWFKGPHVADIKSVVFWSSSSTHVVILRRWQKPRNIFVTETFVIVVRNYYLSKSSLVGCAQAGNGHTNTGNTLAGQTNSPSVATPKQPSKPDPHRKWQGQGRPCQGT